MFYQSDIFFFFVSLNIQYYQETQYRELQVNSFIQSCSLQLGKWLRSGMALDIGLYNS